jgi:hypothetical protein
VQLLLPLEELLLEGWEGMVGFDRLDILRQRIHLYLLEAQACLRAGSAGFASLVLRNRRVTRWR